MHPLHLLRIPDSALFSQGRAFGSISASFGPANHILDQVQHTVLLTAVIGSAIVPTLIAQILFQPRFEPSEEDACLFVLGGRKLADTLTPVEST